ncbi:Na+/H+ antiporter NhaA [Cellulomonas sp. ATA003]|uniref:Na+/H+ antiporter NhaA n=1 Tax=Cellulomonas sp. ATA003 TaxID=3073064 RepID=UPI002872F275|nr:Na+/H+ antiporter NhaA [Cellulomonas sp. ATA003]WNB86194.1 Na+/H+ antiporter NhaA [Cellulomonas sp. ATA003]
MSRATTRPAQSRAASDSAGLLTRVAPLGRRLRTEAGGAALLLAATVAALGWANSPWGETYDAFWHTDLAVRVGASELSLDLRHWVNDGLMTFFFFVIGLEVKRELVLGELADRRRAAVPALAALIGLVVPALVYVTFNLGDAAVSAWGVVISTDTAFLLGVLALLGSACPPQLRVFLLALAIADDVGALSVIAIFYTEDLALVPLAVAGVGFAAMLGLRRLRVWRGPAYLVLGVAAWVAMYLSGVHPTLLGVAVALATPAYPPRREEVADAARRTRAYLQSPNPEFADAARLSIARSVPVGERLQQLWRPWTGMVMVPLFALANAGVPLTGETLRAAATSPVTLGVVAGLVVGKLVGILIGTGLAVRLRLGDLAPGLGGLQLAGGAALSGIGFTISLFIVDLALADERLADQARVGVLAASVLATALGVTLLRLAARRRPDEAELVLDPPVDPERDHVRGPVDAPLTLVEYGDFECPFCGQATGAVAELRERFGDRLRYVFRHAPLVDVHPHAQLAAEAAEAAAAQGRFWDMRDRLFAAQDRLTSADLVDHAAALGLDAARFARDLGAGRYTRRVEQDRESGQVSGVRGTPTFFVGEHRHTGPFDADTLAAALLADAGLGQGPAAPRAVDVPTGDVTPGSAGAGTGRPRMTPALPELPEDLPETPARGGDHPRLTDAQVAALDPHGTRVPVARGDVLYRVGDDTYDLHVVLSGAVAVVGFPENGGEPLVRVHGPRRFLGELDLFDDEPVRRTAVVVRPGEVLRITADRLRSLLADDPALRDLVTRAFLVRRAIRYELDADLRILGRRDSPEVRRLVDHALAHGLTTDVVEISETGDADELLAHLGASPADLPLVVARSGRVLHDPTEEDLAREL